MADGRSILPRRSSRMSAGATSYHLVSPAFTAVLVGRVPTRRSIWSAASAAKTFPPGPWTAAPACGSERVSNLHCSRECSSALHFDRRQLRRPLRACRERPHTRTAEQRDELAPLHSITSSARARKDSGIVRLIAFAAFTLTTSSNLVA